jgi:hypothetical protein
VGFAGPEEAGNPDAVASLSLFVVGHEGVEALADFVGDDVFLDLGGEVAVVVRLDDALDRTLDVFAEECANGGYGGDQRW